MIRRVFPLILLATFTLLGCEGRPAETCSADRDCAGELVCAGPDDPQVCGIPPRAECREDAECGPELRCHSIDDPCSLSGVGTVCGGPCAPGVCGDGFRCNAAGACEAVPCGEGFTCTDQQRCQAEPLAPEQAVYDRGHGCVAIACAADADCPATGACVHGVCQSGPGHCTEFMAVP